MRRSTSLAVCWAPIRMTPSDRPRSARSSRICLIGLSPSRGAYLFSSSSITNISGRAVPWRSLRANSARSVTPTTNRCARSGRLCRSTTVTWAREVLIDRSPRCARSPRTITLSGGTADRSRRSSAFTLPVTVLPATQDPRVASSPSSASSRSTRSAKVRTIRRRPGSTPCDPDRAVAARRDGVPAQPGRDLGDQHRVLGPLVLGVGEHERQQFLLAELGERPVERADRPVPRVHVGRARRVVLARRREDPDVAERRRGQSEPGVASPLGRGQPGCWRSRGRAGPRPSR